MLEPRIETMRSRTTVAGALMLCGIFGASRAAGAQAPCSTSPALADSARADIAAVMTSGSPLVAELRQEQKLSDNETGARSAVVNERYVCARIAAAFTHIVAPGTTFPVLRVGSMYYARDPDQRQATGVITDSTFKVLMRLGRSVDVRSQGQPTKSRP
jgi:hypothetical protein